MECAESSSPKASSAPATVARGAKSPPMASNAIRAKLGFPGCYSLLAAVIPALLAHMVRSLHRLTTRAFLNHNGGRRLVCVAAALLPFRGTSLRDGHFESVRK